MSATLVRAKAVELLTPELAPIAVDEIEDGLIDPTNFRSLTLKNGHVLVAWAGVEGIEPATDKALWTDSAFAAMCMTNGKQRSERAAAIAMKVAGFLWNNTLGIELARYPTNIEITPHYDARLSKAQVSMVVVTWRMVTLEDLAASILRPETFPAYPPLEGVDLVDDNALPFHQINTE